MQCWVWGEMHPDFVDGLVPLASAPTQIAGRNRVMRTMIMDSIKNDPAWKNGDYAEQPHAGLVGAVNLLMMMTSSPIGWHKSGPTRDAADTWYEGQFSVRKAFESVFGSVTCVSGPLACFRMSAIYNFMPAWAEDRFLGQEFRFATDRTLTAYVLGGSHLSSSALPKASGTKFAEPRYPARDWKIVYCKSARAWTNVPANLRAIVRQQVRWKKSFLRNIFTMGAFYWRRPFLPALLYYLHILFVLLGPVIAARHLIYLPLRGDLMSLALYLAGIVLIGLSFGLVYRHENPGSRRWLCRPAMSLRVSGLIFREPIVISTILSPRSP